MTDDTNPPQGASAGNGAPIPNETDYGAGPAPELKSKLAQGHRDGQRCRSGRCVGAAFGSQGWR